VIDVDGPKGRSAVESLGLPPTAKVITSRGHHLHYVGVPYKRPPSLQQVDYRYGGRGYVVAPPSLHASGHRYRWVMGTRSFAKLPQSFFTGSEVFDPVDVDIDPERHDADEVLKRYGRKMPHAVRVLAEHQRVVGRSDRSRCIFLVAARLHEAGASPDEIAAVLWRSPYFTSRQHGQSLRALQTEVSRILAKLGAFE
jgi:hypothetical protein